MTSKRSEFPVLEWLGSVVWEILRYRKLDLAILVGMLAIIGVLAAVVASMAAEGWNQRPRGIL